MRVQIICNKDTLFRPGIQHVGSVSENFCKIRCCPDFRHNCFPPACQWFGDHKDICHTITDIYGIRFLRLPWFTGDAGFFYQLLICFIYADDGGKGIIWPLVNFQHIFHLCHKFGVCLRDAPFLYKPRFNFIFFCFFHNLADGGISNIIYHFQTEQFIRDGLHGPSGSTLGRSGTGNGTNSGFHIPSHLAAAVLLLFPVEGSFHTVHDKPFRNACNGTVGSAIYIFDTVIGPRFVFRPLVQFQKYLCMPDTVSFPTFLNQCFEFLYFTVCQSNNVTWHICILQYRF